MMTKIENKNAITSSIKTSAQDTSALGLRKCSAP